MSIQPKLTLPPRPGKWYVRRDGLLCVCLSPSLVEKDGNTGADFVFEVKSEAGRGLTWLDKNGKTAFPDDQYCVQAELVNDYVFTPDPGDGYRLLNPDTDWIHGVDQLYHPTCETPGKETGDWLTPRYPQYVGLNPGEPTHEIERPFWRRPIDKPTSTLDNGGWSPTMNLRTTEHKSDDLFRFTGFHKVYGPYGAVIEQEWKHADGRREWRPLPHHE